MDRLFKSINMYNQYIKFRIPSLKSDIYLIKWLPHSKTKSTLISLLYSMIRRLMFSYKYKMIGKYFAFLLAPFDSLVGFPSSSYFFLFLSTCLDRMAICVESVL